MMLKKVVEDSLKKLLSIIIIPSTKKRLKDMIKLYAWIALINNTQWHRKTREGGKCKIEWQRVQTV